MNYDLVDPEVVAGVNGAQQSRDSKAHDLCESEEDPYWGDGLIREPWEGVARRAADFALWLRDTPERHIAVASHSAFLLTIFNGVFRTESEEARRWFGTGEMRTVLLSYSENQPANGPGYDRAAKLLGWS